MRRGGTGTGSKGESTNKVTSAPLSPGQYEGRLVYLADLGLQKKEYAGEDKGQFYQMALGIEIIGEKTVFEDDDGETTEVPKLMWTRPHWAYDTMDERGKELILYRAFDPSATAGQVPDWESQLGKPCTVVVTNQNGKGDKAKVVYDNIETLVAIPEKYQDSVDAAETTPAQNDPDDPENAVNKKLFGLVKYVFDKRIEGTPQGAPKKQDFDKEEFANQGGNSIHDEFDDDIPF